jgi:hypothetical protein
MKSTTDIITYQSISQIDPGYILNHPQNFELNKGKFPRSISEIFRVFISILGHISELTFTIIMILIPLLLTFLSLKGFLDFMSGHVEWSNIMVFWLGGLPASIYYIFFSKDNLISHLIYLLKQLSQSLKAMRRVLYPHGGILLKAPIHEIQIQKGRRDKTPISLITIKFQFMIPDGRTIESTIQKERNIKRNGEWVYSPRPWLAVYYWNISEFTVI